MQKGMWQRGVGGGGGALYSFDRGSQHRKNCAFRIRRLEPWVSRCKSDLSVRYPGEFPSTPIPFFRRVPYIFPLDK